MLSPVLCYPAHPVPLPSRSPSLPSFLVHSSLPRPILTVAKQHQAEAEAAHAEQLRLAREETQVDSYSSPDAYSYSSRDT